MDKIIERIKKDLEQIETQVEEKGFTKEKLDFANTLLDTLKEAKEIKAMDEGDKYMNYGRYDEYRGDYEERDGRGNYREGGDREGGYRGNYGREGGNYRGMRYYLDRINDGAEMYEYGRDSYRHGDNDQRMIEGLERLMYGVCMLVEATMEFAESPEEKEIVRKHIHKLKNM